MHVNDCLDGKTRDPEPQPVTSDKTMTRIEKAAIARPAQPDPYRAKRPDSKSAFSKMMAGNAEDTAAVGNNEVLGAVESLHTLTVPRLDDIPDEAILTHLRWGRTGIAIPTSRHR